MRIAERLAHQLGGPVIALAVRGLNTGDYERHFGVVCGGELASEGALENGGCGLEFVVWSVVCEC